MPSMDIPALMKRAARAETKRQQFATLMQDVYAYAMPERDGWNSYGYGENRHIKVYDSTAVVSLARFANRLQSALFPPGQRWAQLTLPPEFAAAEEAQDVQVDLQAATDLVFRHLHASNFDMAINEWAQEVGAGAGCLLIEDGRLGTRRARAPRLRFTAVPSAKVAFDEGPFGTVEGVFFEQELPARLVRRTYPDATGLPPELLQAEADDAETAVQLLQCTYYEPEDDRFLFEVIHKPTRTRIVSRRYRTMPWVISRWTKAPGEVHGRGPLTQALPDIRVMNKLQELNLQTASLAVAGVWTAMDDGVLNPANVRITPGAVIPVRSNGGPMGPSLRGLEFPGQYQVAMDMMDRLGTRVRQVLFDDPLPPEVQVGLTATEVIERVRRFQQDTGAFGRLTFDAVIPIMTRCLDILDQAGEFSGPRFQGLMDEVQNDAIRIRPSSPLSQAQDMADVQAVMQFLAGGAQLGEVGMQFIAAGVDAPAAGRFVAERMGVPAQLIPTEQQLAERQAAAAQQAQEAALLQSPAAAQVAGAVANAAVQPPEQEPMR